MYTVLIAVICLFVAAAAIFVYAVNSVIREIDDFYFDDKKNDDIN